MKAESEYFRHFESEHTTPITWQEMIAEGEVIGPNALMRTIEDAMRFLQTEPGPNLERRTELAYSWLKDWEQIIRQNSEVSEREKQMIETSGSLVSFDSLKSVLQRDIHDGYMLKTSGIINLAGGEGHSGHLTTASYMASTVDTVVWAFEQESFL